VQFTMSSHGIGGALADGYLTVSAIRGKPLLPR
jgi:hypothetical protein